MEGKQQLSRSRFWLPAEEGLGRSTHLEAGSRPGSNGIELAAHRRAPLKHRARLGIVALRLADQVPYQHCPELHHLSGRSLACCNVRRYNPRSLPPLLLQQEHQNVNAEHAGHSGS